MKKLPLVYSTFFTLVVVSWLFYMITHEGFALYSSHWLAPFTMIFGSFIAGASSEGGGAIAFPVFTLLMKVPPDTARNFSFAIQSIGMTAASTLIVGFKIPVSWRAIFYTSISGIVGLLIGTFYVVPIVPATETKLFFVSLWLSFGFALYLANRNPERSVLDDLPSLKTKDKFYIILFGIIGGLITAIFGNGIDIFTFCFFTLYYKLNEKVATPTSVIIMTTNTIVGFGLHYFVIQDFQPLAFNFWLCSVPVVLVFAPLGAYVITFLSRTTIANILYFIILAQYIGAIYTIRPSFYQLLLSTSILATGFLFFWQIAKSKPFSQSSK